MIAAIYARKSTEQLGIADEQKSVARQIEHARQYATRKGCTVADEHVYVDDGISGAEFSNRPGFVRLMNALKPRPAFQVLVMSEESRLGREAIETAYALKQLVTAGVRVFFYLEDRERTLESPTDKIMLSLTAFADELEREKARQRVTDAMLRKARAGHVCGGACFGYRNVEITAPGPDGRLHRQYVRRHVEPDEAAVVRRIFELCAAGNGLKGITKILNAEGARAPRNHRGRPRAWAPSSVREALYREWYRGLYTWNKTRTRDAWGRKKGDYWQRPMSEWIRYESEDLRVVSDQLWDAAHARLSERRENYRAWTHQEAARAIEARGERRSYLLSGFASCGLCGGSIQVITRGSTKGRRLCRYGCGQHLGRGATVCGNTRLVKLDLVDAEIRALMATEVLNPTRIEAALDKAIAMLQVATTCQLPDRDRLQKRLCDVERTLANLTETAAKGGAVPAVLEALNRADAERRALIASIEARSKPAVDTCPDVRTLRRTLRRYLDEWHAMLQGNVTEARGLLDVVLRERSRSHRRSGWTETRCTS